MRRITWLCDMKAVLTTHGEGYHPQSRLMPRQSSQLCSGCLGKVNLMHGLKWLVTCLFLESPCQYLGKTSLVS